MTEVPGHFDNPVYSYQAPSVQSDASTLLHQNGHLNNLRHTKPNNLDRMNNFHDDDSNVSSRAGTYSIQFDSDMSHKNYQADMTNPNLYQSIDDHVYDEIKNKDGYKDIGKNNYLFNLFLIKIMFYC